MEQFAEYSHAIVAVALWAVLALLLGPAAAAFKGNAGMEPGATPAADYSSKIFRVDRAYQNCIESLAAFAAVTAMAIFAGASPFWINLLASVSLVARVAMVYVHIRGIGAPANGPRSALYALGWAMHMVIAVMAVVAAF